ncbi:MAG: hypothetical protein IPP72_06725 [Chitinophagaceae bacterium]|nr:hypothetical protein [Chitinophagaceae bacterium]
MKGRISTKKRYHYVFCESSLYQSCYDLNNAANKTSMVFIHAAKTKSIVGSNDKNQPGVAIEL